MILAVEDSLSEATARRLLGTFRPDLEPPILVGLKGAGFLRSKCRELNRVSANMPVMLLTDQDVPGQCPPRLIARWLGRPPQRGLLFRVAVMEIESWVMADREGFANFVRVPTHRVPLHPDSIPNPKQFLVNLARKSRLRQIQCDLVPASGSTAQVGPAYNPQLVAFMSTIWNPAAAVNASPSLRRTVDRLRHAFR